MDRIQIHCPACAKALKLPQTHMGKKCRCPGCFTVFVANAHSGSGSIPDHEDSTPAEPIRATAPPVTTKAKSIPKADLPPEHSDGLLADAEPAPVMRNRIRLDDPDSDTDPRPIIHHDPEPEAHPHDPQIEMEIGQSPEPSRKSYSGPRVQNSHSHGALIAGILCVLLAVGGGLGLYIYNKNKSAAPPVATTGPKPGAVVEDNSSASQGNTELPRPENDPTSRLTTIFSERPSRPSTTRQNTEVSPIDPRTPAVSIPTPPAQTRPATQPVSLAPSTQPVAPIASKYPDVPSQTQPATQPAVAIAQTRPADPPATAPVAVATQPAIENPPATKPAQIAQTQIVPETRPVIASTQPASEADRLRERFNQYLQQGTNALAAGEAQAALESLSDAKLVFEQRLRLRQAIVGSPEHVAVMHGMAIAHLLLNRLDPASLLFDPGSILDRACSSKTVSRQMLITRGAIDVQRKVTAMRTVLRLNDYLKDHPDELDSEIMDVLFSALVLSNDFSPAREALLANATKLYEQLNAKLESTRPGQRRWGVKWVTPEQYAANMQARQTYVTAWQAALDKQRQCTAYIRQCEVNLEDERNRGFGNRKNIEAASEELARAKKLYSNFDRASVAARLKIPLLPIMSAAELKPLLVPRDVTIASAGKSVAGTNPSTLPSETASARVIKQGDFNLGGTESKAGPATGPVTVNTPSKPDTTFTPPAPAPPSKRTFSRSAVGFAVGPDLFLTSGSSVAGAKRIIIEFQDGQPIEAAVLRADGDLALIRIPNRNYPFYNLAEKPVGGAITCPAFPDVSLFGLKSEVLKGTISTEASPWIVIFGRHPRLPGAPLLDAAGNLQGIELADRDRPHDKCPMISVDKVRAFLGKDIPTERCANPQAAPVVQITAQIER